MLKHQNDTHVQNKTKYTIWLVENYMPSQPHSLSAKNDPSAVLLAGQMHGLKTFLGGLSRDLLNDDYRGVVDGLHDGGQATAQVVGLVNMDFGRVFKNHRLSRTIQNSG